MIIRLSRVPSCLESVASRRISCAGALSPPSAVRSREGGDKGEGLARLAGNQIAQRGARGPARKLHGIVLGCRKDLREECARRPALRSEEKAESGRTEHEVDLLRPREAERKLPAAHVR